MGEPLQVGQYHLNNLITNQVPFLLIDLRTSEERSSPDAAHPLLERAVPAVLETVMQTAKEKTSDPSSPIVVFCETGDVSIRAAMQLEEGGYVNVYVLSGGRRSLTS